MNPGEAKPSAEAAAALASARFVFGFLQGLHELSGGDIVDRVLWLAVADAGTRHLTQDAVLNRRHAGLGPPPPDAVRLPVSVSAIARATGLSFETARRRILEMARREVCEIQPGRGVLVTAAHLSRPQSVEEMVRVYTALNLFHRELTGLGITVRPEARAHVAPSLPGMPVRLCWRASLGYVLRYMQVLEPVLGGLVDVSIVLGVGVLGGASGRPQRPVTPTELARALKGSRETVRRHLLDLVEGGVLERRDDGYLITAAFLKGPETATHRERTARLLESLFRGLAGLGVTFADEFAVV